MFIKIIFLFLCFIDFSFALEEALNPLKSNKVAVIQLSFDGVNTQHCGVGTVVLQTQKVLEELNVRYQDCFKLYLISADYAESLSEYSANLLKQNRKDCQKSGGDVYLISTHQKNEMFGTPEQWEELCDRGADICTSIINDNKYTIILAHDTAYAQIPLKIHERLRNIKSFYKALWIPHATSWQYNGHTPENKPNWPERHNWELEALKKAKECGYEVGYISSTIKQDMITSPFYADESILTSYKTGIILDKYLKTYSQEEIATELTKRNIPLDKRLIFSIGRASPLKGHDITLEMYRHLKYQYSDIHLVMLAPCSDYMPEYLELLQKRIKEENLDVTLIDQFDAQLDAYIYQWPKTELLCLLSRADTQPLTVMEGRANPTNCILLTSNGNRSGNQVQHGQDGFTCSLEGLDQIIKSPVESPFLERIISMASKILNLSYEKRLDIIKSGKELILSKYDLRTNMLSNFDNLLSKSDEPLIFEKIKGGMTNPPTLVLSKNKTPIGVLKVIKGNKDNAALRLKILWDVYQSGFSHIPKIFKNNQESLLTNLGENFYYFIEYLPSDSFPITTPEMLKLTGDFHKVIKPYSLPSLLKKSKWEEFFKRSNCFDDPWFQKYNIQVFTGFKWDKICELGHYFASGAFKEIYESLSKQLIHGDNNQINVVKNGKNIFLIDFDTLRYDIRLIDLATYFRYGGFDDYVALIKKNELNKIVNKFYSIKAGALSAIEENVFPLIVMFSHIEFISWLMETLKYAVEENDQSLAEERLNLIKSYQEQILILKELREV